VPRRWSTSAKRGAPWPVLRVRGGHRINRRRVGASPGGVLSGPLACASSSAPRAQRANAEQLRGLPHGHTMDDTAATGRRGRSATRPAASWSAASSGQCSRSTGSPDRAAPSWPRAGARVRRRRPGEGVRRRRAHPWSLHYQVLKRTTARSATVTDCSDATCSPLASGSSPSHWSRGKACHAVR
jgi:hypothetical protein